MTPIISTLAGASFRGFSPYIVAPAATITPEYWWRADSGLSTSGWTAYNGGVNFTFYNVTSANSTTGVYFNGSTSYGLTSALSSNIDAKHIMMRFDTFSRTTQTSMGGGSQNNIHEWNFYINSSGFVWYHIERLVSALTYAARGTTDVGTSLIWLDFANSGASNINMYVDNSSTVHQQGIYAGTFNNRFRWESGYGIYLGRRHEGNYSSYYLKEFAVFTTALSQSEANTFRDGMLTRWP